MATSRQLIIILFFNFQFLQNQLPKIIKMLRTLVQHWEGTHLLAMLSKAKPTENTTLQLEIRLFDMH